ncbi:hypothetical protein [Geobacter sp.]|uniref:hypothetical protein n=1 Tax=Geobacter sp. TaxID=46610 RepID=UPI0026372286|nr:hypothetical protein [Geobacter sp.]
MRRVVQSVILLDANGEEYRLVAGTPAPELPEHLTQAAEESGYIAEVAEPEHRPAARVNHNSRKGAK